MSYHAQNILNKLYSIVSGLLFSFSKKSAQGPTQLRWQDVCGSCF